MALQATPHPLPALSPARLEALRLAVQLADAQTPPKAITHLATVFEQWLTRPQGGSDA